MQKTHLVLLSLFVILLFLYGCTEDEEKQFEQDLERQMVENAQHSVENSVSSTINSTINGIKSTVGLKNENNSMQTSPNGECKFDSDCPTVCEGSTFWKQGCDAQTNKCIKTFDTDCTANPTVIGSYNFPKLCTVNGCVDDTDSIHTKKEELIKKANDFTAAMQQTTAMRQAASKNCLSALADVTDSLIINTALIFSAPDKMFPGADLFSATAQQVMDQINSATSTKMPVEEYISLNCNAVRVLDSEYALQAKKRDLAIQDAETFAGH